MGKVFGIRLNFLVDNSESLLTFFASIGIGVSLISFKQFSNYVTYLPLQHVFNLIPPVVDIHVMVN